MKKNNDARVGCLCAIACEVLFGFSYLFTKNATEEASELALLGWRFFIAAMVMGICAAIGIIKINLKRKSLRPLLMAALFSPVIYFIGETFGISHTTASESGAFLACIPAASLIASSMILKKNRPKYR
ncbi:MAG: DMT family transporter [Synergistes sp.]|nr:DMT family transporter [Synergistes sp.]